MFGDCDSSFVSRLGSRSDGSGSKGTSYNGGMEFRWKLFLRLGRILLRKLPKIACLPKPGTRGWLRM